MNAKTLLTGTLLMALGTACGRAPDDTSDVPTPTPVATATEEVTPTPAPEATPEPAATPEPSPTPTFADGVYASRFGIDSNPGTGTQHVRTLRAAIDRAKALGKKDVWLASDADGWEWNEIVTVPDGINLHGGVCVTTYPMTPPAVVDAAACRTAIVGASPALLADRITVPTLVENLEVRGRGIELDTEYAFKVPGGACLGRASAAAAASLNVTQACTPATDEDGAALPRSSFAAWASSSTNLTFSNVRLVAAAAESGREGVDGVAGENGSAASGQTAGVNAACSAANGGAGGNGGAWTYRSVPRGIDATLVPSTSGVASAMAAGTAGAAGANDLIRMSGSSGTTALSSGVSFAASVADAGTAVIDDATFVAGSGAIGADGRDGAGGSGGGGGAVGVTFVFRYCASGDSTSVCSGRSGWVPVGEGAVSYNESIVDSMAQNGETRGGAGGAGGAGGCGGTAATAGKGGASSVALVVRSSQITVRMSALVTGNAGNGGKGGVGGAGGNGGSAAAGTAGTSTAQYNINGVVLVKATGPEVQTISGGPRVDASDTKGVSQSKGGDGGHGAAGQHGEAGATGGSGAGGASVGLFGIRSVVDVEDVTYELGNAGLGGRSDDDLSLGENGIRAPEVAQD